MSFSAFKGLRIYRLSAPLPFSVEQFNEQLESFRFQPCQAQDMSKSGFYQPLHFSMSSLAHKSGSLIVFSVKTQDKILPIQSVNDELAPKIAQKERELGRPLARREKTELKEAVTQSLLPRCLTRSSIVHGYYDVARNLLVIGAASSSKCEDVLALLRKALGSLPALPFFDAHELNNKLQIWGRNQELPVGFSLGSKLHFKAPDEEGGKARFDNHLLMHDDVQAQFQDKLAILLELDLADEMTFTLKEDGSLSGIKYNDLLIGQNDEMGWDDTLARLDADMLLLSESLGKLIDVMVVSVPFNQPPDAGASEQSTEVGEDALLNDVMAFVVSTRRASVSAIQRNFKIGYNRASRLVEMLEQQGVVSAASGDGGREVIV